MKKKISYLGPAGTFTGIATKRLFGGEDVELYPFDTTEECVDMLQRGESDYAVVPIENSIGGRVTITTDMLVHSISIPIQAEVRLEIQQDLLVHSENKEKLNRSEYTTIISHPQAITQCSTYLRKYYPQAKIQYANSTAEAAQIIANHPQEAWLAIANDEAREIYGLAIMQAAIQDYQFNTTRFFALGREPLALTADKCKTSLLVSLPDADLAVLPAVLDAFVSRDLELIRVEAAPMKTEMGQYYYLIDLQATDELPSYDQACQEITNMGCQIRELGTSFPCFFKSVTPVTI